MLTTRERILKIKRVMRAQDWTKEELENATGLGYSTIWRLVKGIGKPNRTTIASLERALGIDRRRFI